jgi:pectin methylesterase-like acyl-CoA thioesterase
VIAGQTDFLYGFGTAYIEKSTLSLRNCGGGITAWKGPHVNTEHVHWGNCSSLTLGTNTTFTNKYGVYISDSQVLAANASIAATIQGKCPLGRPWNAQHRSIFMDAYLDASIKPQGYTPWGTTDPRTNNYTFMAVYDDYGPGWTPDTMAASGVTIVLNTTAVEPYRNPTDVFIASDGTPGNVGWVDKSVMKH